MKIFFLFGDDFEAILDILEHVEDTEKYFEAAAEDVSINFVLFFVLKWDEVYENAKFRPEPARKLRLENMVSSFVVRDIFEVKF